MILNAFYSDDGVLTGFEKDYHGMKFSSRKINKFSRRLNRFSQIFSFALYFLAKARDFADFI